MENRGDIRCHHVVCFESELLTDLELAHWARLAGQQGLRMLLSLLPLCWGYKYIHCIQHCFLSLYLRPYNSEAHEKYLRRPLNCFFNYHLFCLFLHYLFFPPSILALSSLPPFFSPSLPSSPLFLPSFIFKWKKEPTEFIVC